MLFVLLLTTVCVSCADPQYLADVQDAWHLTRNMFDANALALTFGSSVQSVDLAKRSSCLGLDWTTTRMTQGRTISYQVSTPLGP